MEIRFAKPEDIPGIVRLLRQVGQVHHAIRPDLVREGALKCDAPALEKLLSDPEQPIFVAVEEGAVLGYAICILQQVRNNPVLQDRKELFLSDLCVEELYRGQGIAGPLFAYVKEFARAQGCQALTLNVWCGNDRAIRFYEKCGLTPQKIRMETILC